MCMSCHRLAGVGGLGGGNLGPDLTNVYERLKGRASLGAWLSAPATPTMQSLLAEKKLEPDEIKSLLALFEDRATKREPDPPGPAMVGFSIIGLIGVLLVLFLFDSFWSNRLRSIRRKMVDDAKI